MSVFAILVVLLVMVVPIYLCFEASKANYESNKKLKIFASIFLYGFLGAFLSSILFYLLASILPVAQEDSIVLAIIVLSSIICGCAAWIVQTIKNNRI